jgi:uncharacterized protein
VADIFLSYARIDRAKVEPIVTMLSKKGWSVFWDPTIVPGDRWDSLIERELKLAKCVVVVWSTKSVQSHWVKDEAAYGRDLSHLVPIKIDGCVAPLGFRQIQVGDFTSWTGSADDPSATALFLALYRILQTKPYFNFTDSTLAPSSKGIDYDHIVRGALRSALRVVLTQVVRDSLPGDHHFYITFRTDFENVRISKRLRDRFPTSMTIVLQYQFWDLAVHDDSFEVGLSFSGLPEQISIPFESITAFFDPSVKFGLDFENLSNKTPVADSS